MARGIFSVVAEDQNVSTAITILELTAPATAIVEILRAWCNVSGGTAAVTSAILRMQLLRKTGTITGTASPPTIRGFDGGAAVGSTVKWKATAEGTDGNILDSEGFNVLSGGYLWVPTTQRNRIIIPPSGLIALKFPAAPAANLNFTFGFEFEEVG